ncbi:MAG TPA: transglycosylase SLT domain-containing protein [Stellaceae bacterium]|nr:transglycosylase SLT domain-containing protein [Stellaceae bacterium]
MPAPTHPLPHSAAIDPAVAKSIRQASAATSVDFGLLVAEAQQESGFDPKAKAPNSSATGLYQFIDGTWLQMVQRFGVKYGIGNLAQRVTLDDAGRPRVADPAVRQQILDLRRDPKLSAAFAAEFTRSNQADLERALGRSVNHADLYMAHFLGAGGASRFLQAFGSNGDAIAADLLPEAAAANKPVFYDSRTGAPRTVAEIYRVFADKVSQYAHSLDGETAGASIPTTSPAPAATGKIAAVLGRFGIDGGTSVVTRPFRAMLDALAVSALKLVRGGGNAAPAQSRHRSALDV